MLVTWLTMIVIALGLGVVVSAVVRTVGRVQSKPILNAVTFGVAAVIFVLSVTVT